MFLRGGGYGIAGLAWDSYLSVDVANARLGSATIQTGDRIRSVQNRTVFRDADLRGVLRASDSDSLWIEIERIDYEIALPLTPEQIEQDEIPAALRGPYRVVAIDDRAIIGDMHLADMGAWMRSHDDQPAVFTVRIPEYSIQGQAMRVRRPGPILPVVVLVFTLGVVFLSLMRGRSEVMARRRRLWHSVGLSAASGGVLIAFLIWHDGFLADPVLLPFGLVAITLWRPLSMSLHQLPRGELTVTSARFVRLGTALPCAIVLLAAIYGWSRTIPDVFGTPLDGFVFDQMRLLVLVAAVVAVLYHASDLTLHALFMRSIRGRPKTAGEMIPWISMVLAAFAVLSSIIAASAAPEQFVERGYVVHLGILVGIQWLGDLTLLPQKTPSQPLESENVAIIPPHRFLEDARDRLGLRYPCFAVCLPSNSVLLSLNSDQHDEFETDSVSDFDDESLPMSPLASELVSEKLEGLLELLESEGGMFPHFKVIRGSDEDVDDPFDGMDRTVGVSLVLPIDAPRQAEDTVRVYLVNRLPEEQDFPDPLPEGSEVTSWAGQLSRNLVAWNELRAVAAVEALALIKVAQLADPPTPQAPVTHEPAQPAPSEQAAGGESGSNGRADRGSAAALYHLLAGSESAYPVNDPEAAHEGLCALVSPFLDSRGPMAIVGPSGSGKEFLARLIHTRTAPDQPFMILDCGALPPAVVMAELFGESDVPGQLEVSSGGIQCIRGLSNCPDDIIQEVLEGTRKEDARAVLLERGSDSKLAGSLERAVDEAVLVVPPLTDRPEWVLRAATYYLHRHAMAHGRVVTGFGEAAREWLATQTWPANYHDLIGTVRRAVLRGNTQTVTLADFAVTEPRSEPTGNLVAAIEDVEKHAVLSALEEANGNKSAAARSLGMKRTTFLRKLAKYGLDAG